MLLIIAIGGVIFTIIGRVMEIQNRSFIFYKLISYLIAISCHLLRPKTSLSGVFGIVFQNPKHVPVPGKSIGVSGEYFAALSTMQMVSI